MPSFASLGNDLYAGRRSIDFIGRRKLWYVIAVIAVAISLLSLAARGLNQGIEFRGGSEFRVSHATSTEELKGQHAVTDVIANADPRVTRVGTDGIRVQTSSLTVTDRDRVQRSLAKAYGVLESNVSVNFVGPTWGRDVSQKAITSLIVFLFLVAAFMALYFRTWKMAVAGLVALVHDLLLTMGIYALSGFEVTPATVIGFLTILGYSLYDTVVVFDKVRENTEHLTGSTRRTFREAANLAVNQTLVRSINTSVVALLPVGAILFIGALLLGAGTLKDISLSLFVGIAAGTYSSIFIATPLLVHLRENEPEFVAQAQRVVKRRHNEAGLADDGLEGPALAGRAAVSVGARAASSTSVGAEAVLRPAAGNQRQQPRKATGANRSRPTGRKR